MVSSERQQECFDEYFSAAAAGIPPEAYAEGLASPDLCEVSSKGDVFQLALKYDILQLLFCNYTGCLQSSRCYRI
jgi:hypothetical protein